MILNIRNFRNFYPFNFEAYWIYWPSKKEWREKVKYQKGIYVIGRVDRKQINHSTTYGPNKIIHAGQVVSSLSASLKESDECLIAALKSSISSVPKYCALIPHNGSLIICFIRSGKILPPRATLKKARGCRNFYFS